MVALLTEGVDRNKNCKFKAGIIFRVALLTEGVDRNYYDIGGHSFAMVALLTEGVDRNQEEKLYTNIEAKSPSSRRAWIEIT